jgi:hypothetical protein
LSLTNAQTYYEESLLRTTKRFITLAPVSIKTIQLSFPKHFLRRRRRRRLVEDRLSLYCRNRRSKVESNTVGLTGLVSALPVLASRRNLAKTTFGRRINIALDQYNKMTCFI